MIHEPLCPPDVPCRYGFWNIPAPLEIVFYATMAIAVALLLWGIVRRVVLWRRGQPEFGLDRPIARLGRLIKYGVAQVKVLRQRYPGTFHFALFWGMVVLFIGTVLATIDSDVFELFFNAKLLLGGFYVFYKVVLDLAGLGFLIGLGMAMYRRYIVRPPRLNIDWRFNFTEPLLGLIIITGFLIGALRLAVMNPPWGPAQVVAYPISRFLQGAPTEALETAHRVMWITHYMIVAAFFATLPYTNLFHIFSSPANIFVAPFRKRGALWPIRDLEQADQLGAAKLTDFAWPRLANFDSCTECGRCQDVCPAFAALEPLNPKYVILNLRDYMTEQQDQLRKLPAKRKVATSGDGSQAAEAPKATAPGAGDNGTGKNNGRKMVGDIITPEVLWDCTTCMHCVYECPVLIEHVDAIVDMRRQLALMEGNVPPSLATTLTNMERAGNPWKQPRRKRAAWTQALDFEIPIMANVGEADVLWWVGCAGSYDPRNQKVTRALAKILHEAGVNFAILGEEETCNGDQARRAGNEYLFQQLAMQNIETMKQYKFKTIVTQCPHCFNVLQNEYPQMGGDYQVMHHSQFIQKLLNNGDIRVRRTAGGEESLTYHDPCYLGRYNDIYNAPREVATSSGKSLVEMPRSRDMAMCCGGGGARVWMEDEGEVRVNRNRMAQIMETGQRDVAVACPFCMIMLEDARGALDAENVQIRDIAEIVAENLITRVETSEPAI
jgi:Fe-S oxidoreductase/nitrate reductase gamma subunit